MPPYRMLKKLGAGGFGTVYHAIDGANGRQVAIKRLHALTPETRERFEREARILTEHLNNKFVVDLLAYDLSGDAPFLVLEYCEGGSLRSWVTSRRSWQEVVAAIGHALQGLAGSKRSPVWRSARSYTGKSDGAV